MKPGFILSAVLIFSCSHHKINDDSQLASHAYGRTEIDIREVRSVAALSCRQLFAPTKVKNKSLVLLNNLKMIQEFGPQNYHKIDEVVVRDFIDNLVIATDIKHENYLLINNLIVDIIKNSNNLESTFDLLHKLHIVEKFKNIELVEVPAGTTFTEKQRFMLGTAEVLLEKEPLRGWDVVPFGTMTKLQLTSTDGPNNKYMTGKLKSKRFRDIDLYKTAKDRNLKYVSHTTRTKEGLQQIISGGLGSHPNIFISRDGKFGESANAGDGLYVSENNEFRDPTGIYGDYAVFFEVDSAAREGIDYMYVDGSQFVILNKKCLKIYGTKER
jgi:hypothetical protein